LDFFVELLTTIRVEGSRKHDIKPLLFIKDLQRWLIRTVIWANWSLIHCGHSHIFTLASYISIHTHIFVS